MSEKVQGHTRALGVWMCTALVLGNMIGSGVFLLPASLAPYGMLSVIGWIITSIGSIALALIFARLSRLIPREGGPYAYILEGYGDFAGFWIAWGYWIALWCGNAALAVAATSYMQVFFPVLKESHLLQGVFAISLIWIVTWINNRGAQSSGVVAVVTTILKLVPLVAVTVFGLIHMDTANLQFNPENRPIWDSIAATMALTLWAFLGLESASVPAGDVIEPEKTIPKATILGTSLATVIYILSTIALIGLMPYTQLAQSEAPFADAARVMWGDWGYYLVAVGALVACFGALNGWCLMTGHIPYAAAQDKLFPKRFGEHNSKGVPSFGLILSSVLVTILLAIKYAGGDGGVKIFEFVILLATATTLLPYAFCALALLIVMIRNDEKYTSKDWVAPLFMVTIGFIYSLWALYGSGADVVMWGIMLLMVGLPVYVWQIKEQQQDK